MNDLLQKLQHIKAQNLFRRRRILQSPQNVEVVVDGERLLSFCSNDYLGLAADPRVIEALQWGAKQYGAGAGASHLVTGHAAPHHNLEQELAQFVGAERALVFSTGYMANLGVITALMDRHSLVVEDKLNHASLIDAARLAKSEVKRFAHADSNKAASLLRGKATDRLIATDAVFSMDGDIAPLADLLAAAKAGNAWLLADDAHGLGVLGENGRGSFSAAGLELGDPVIYMGTLGKALGTFGAFVAGSDQLIEILIQRARTYIYTTALPPAVAEATRASLRFVREEEWRRQRLQQLLAQFQQGIATLGMKMKPSQTAIQPLVLGSEDAALKAAADLQQQGILVPAIRPPTVPAGTARLRITFSALHEPFHVDRLLDALAKIKVDAI
ncbi:MAG: 8-amino-7-oxononanoate synthase [Acidiferrobacterales bacterium]